ncbi:GNS1/SUR4 membrane family protein [Tripterygium wilfordii]|uniref:very-long-chain 3-oxoacyl-CoA synthase n=1 Tax=Tripterygium wilfordii TaxID=458696 RepID=A0A7J7CGY6_TRIWF|nr:GNS1/SUR4 membrane family protein [Tripterygium wilfordii]
MGMRPKWKRLVTDCQIVQFVFSFAISGRMLYYHFTGSGCSGILGWCFNAVFNASLLLLFVDFHGKSYAKRRAVDKDKRSFGIVGMFGNVGCGRFVIVGKLGICISPSEMARPPSMLENGRATEESQQEAVVRGISTWQILVHRSYASYCIRLWSTKRLSQIHKPETKVVNQCNTDCEGVLKQIPHR